MAKWIRENLGNIMTVAILVGLLGWFYRDRTVSEIWSGTQALLLVALGLGFVIFIHELGHFLAAKWCGVYVHTFSVGFGPAIPGLSFRRKGTLYKLAYFPIGGYVHMLGQDDPGVESKEGFTVDDPRSYKNKTVGQRMVIISAGVVMNVILGLVCFVYAYMAGKPDVAARFGTVSPGSPADAAGIVAGSDFLQINDNKKPTFEDLFFTGAFATPGETKIFLRWRTPEGEEKEAHVVPRLNETDLKPLIGVAPPEGLTIYKGGRSSDPAGIPGSAVAAADFKWGDKIIGVKGPDESEFRPLVNGWDLAKAQIDYVGKPIIFQAEREDENVIEIEVAPVFMYDLGVRLEMGEIITVGDDAPEPMKRVQPGDVLVAVDGDEEFDPIRLPRLIEEKAGQDVELRFNRKGEEEPIVVMVVPPAGHDPWIEEPPMSTNSPGSAPALGIAYKIEPVVRSVPPHSPATGKLEPGDTIKSVAFHDEDGDLGSKIPMEKNHWAGIYWALQAAPTRTVDLEITKKGSDETKSVTIKAVEDKSWPMADRGFFMERETEIVYATGVVDAARLGFRDTYRTIGRIYLNLKGLLTGMLSPKLLSGPLGIPQIAFKMAERGMNELILFLGMISVNLAVINFLPIPVLDGGHMVFLFIEKIRGKPASDNAMIVANIFGIAVLGSLMLFVLYLDISKLF